MAPMSVILVSVVLVQSLAKTETVANGFNRAFYFRSPLSVEQFRRHSLNIRQKRSWAVSTKPGRLKKDKPLLCFDRQGNGVGCLLQIPIRPRLALETSLPFSSSSIQIQVSCGMKGGKDGDDDDDDEEEEYYKEITDPEEVRPAQNV